PLLDGIVAQAENRGDFGYRLVLAVEQDQGLAIRLRDLLDRLPDERLLLTRKCFLGRARLAGGWLAHVVEPRGRFGWPRPPASGVFRKVPRDAREPCAETVRLRERCSLPPCRPEGFLRNVLALRQIATGAVRHGADERLMALYQDFERGCVTLLYALPEVVI